MVYRANMPHLPGADRGDRGPPIPRFREHPHHPIKTKMMKHMNLYVGFLSHILRWLDSLATHPNHLRNGASWSSIREWKACKL